MRILDPTEAAIAEAANIIRSGGLVVMPTETVYGLAGSVLLPDAIRKIFHAKERPAHNPLIVHIADLSQLSQVAKEVTPTAQRIIESLWPGPITVVLEKSDLIPNEVTAGGPTVAVRMPAHPVALELIRRTGHPLAAPSANKFTELSPTRAEDVSESLADRVDIVLDGGPCRVGIESTVIDCTTETPTILRLGDIGKETLEALFGYQISTVGESTRSPGQHPRHYAPRTPIRITDEIQAHETGLTFIAPQNERQIQMPEEPQAYAAALYATLHRLDTMGLSEIVIQRPPQTSPWSAIQDRLSRASTKTP